jgi:hypothetical protein
MKLGGNMIWMYFGIALIYLLGFFLIVWGFKLTKEKHEKAEYIENTAIYNAGVVESFVLFLLSLIIKLIPFWLMKTILIIIGLTLIIFGLFLLNS